MLESEVKLTITEKEAPYAPPEELGEYLLRRWTWREKQSAIAASTKILDAQKKLYSSDIVEYEVQTLLTCIKQAPKGFMLDVAHLTKLDADVGDILMVAARKINGLTSIEQTNLSEPTGETKATST
jgi:hypothetical protein